MSLDWNAEKVPEDVRTVTADVDQPMYGIKKGDKILNPVTQTLVFATMGVGIGVIDDNTVDEFAARLDFWQDINGALMRDGEGNPVRLTKEQVEAHKGLYTNVFPMEKRAAWIKRTALQSDAFLGVKEPKYTR